MATSRGISVPEAARRAGVDKRTLRKWIQDSKLKAEKIDNQWIIDPADLDAFLADRKGQQETISCGFSVVETMELAGVNKTTVRRWIRHGNLAARMVGNQWVIDPADLDAFLADREANQKVVSRGISVPEAARRAGVDKTTVRDWISRGRLAAEKAGGQWTIDIDSFNAFIADRKAKRKKKQKYVSNEISTYDAAICLGVSRPSIVNWIYSGKLKAEKVDNRWIIDADSFNALVADLENKKEGITFKDAEKKTGVSKTAIMHWITTGELKAKQVLHRWIIDPDSFDALMEKNRRRLSMLSIPQAAKMLGVSSTTVRKLVAQNKLKSEMILGHCYIDLDSLDALIAKQEPILTDIKNGISPTEAALSTGISRDTIISWIYSGKLKADMVANRWIIDADSLDAFIARRNAKTIGVNNDHSPQFRANG